MRIVNLRHYRGPYIYCGRFMRFSPVGTLKASPLGNQFGVKKFGSEALRLFREHLWNGIRDGGDVLKALLDIQQDWILGCWCVDLEGEEIFTSAERCHCQLIWKAWRHLREKS